MRSVWEVLGGRLGAPEDSVFHILAATVAAGKQKPSRHTRLGLMLQKAKASTAEGQKWRNADGVRYWEETVYMMVIPALGRQRQGRWLQVQT